MDDRQENSPPHFPAACQKASIPNAEVLEWRLFAEREENGEGEFSCLPFFPQSVLSLRKSSFRPYRNGPVERQGCPWGIAFSGQPLKKRPGGEARHMGYSFQP
uniref:Uncharacterized protein n=1 Tax=Micrurus spixii TaxID=129469 RepID=A0A2D4M3P9_9SAUR